MFLLIQEVTICNICTFHVLFWHTNTINFLHFPILGFVSTILTFRISIADDSSQESKVEFSEDEETLIARMYNLVGERFVRSLTFPLYF